MSVQVERNGDHLVTVLAHCCRGEHEARPSLNHQEALQLAKDLLEALDHGAVERQWCETHDSNAKYATEDGGFICEQGVDPDNLGCRMVSVLVYKEEK